MRSYDRGDYLLSFAAICQSVLIVFQHIMIIVLQVPEEDTTLFRIALSAVPIMIAFVFILKRNIIRVITLYSIVAALLVLHAILFPENVEYIVSEGMRFLIPIIIPTFLCVISIRDFHIFIKTLNFASWLTFFLCVILVVCILTGLSIFEHYNMSLGYGLLIPALTLYTNRSKFSIIASLFLFLTILILGSRGPALVYVLYILGDLIVFKKKYSILILLIGLMVVLVPIVIDYLSEFGINSRTIELLLSGEIGRDSGRGYLYDKVIDNLLEHPCLGIGLYGDRTLLDGFYCHNILLEIILNFGFFWGPLILLLFACSIVYKLFNVNKSYRYVYQIFLVGTIIPLLVSSSYLQNFEIPVLIGLIFTSRINRKRPVGIIS